MKETTLVLLKPDCVAQNLCGEVLSRFEAHGLGIHGMKMLRLTDEVLAEHYAHVRREPFYPALVIFMKSAPVVAVAVHGPDAIETVRGLLGPTDPRRAPKGTIRGDYGGTEVRLNIAHASDSKAAAKRELARFFTEQELFVPHGTRTNQERPAHAHHAL